MDEETRVSARYVAYALEQSPQFICKAAYPYPVVFFRFDEMPIFQHLACVIVNDSSDEMIGCVRSGVELVALEKVRCKGISLLVCGRVRDWWQ